MKIQYKTRNTRLGAESERCVWVADDKHWKYGRYLRSSSTGRHGDSILEVHEGELVFEINISNTGIHRCVLSQVENDELKAVDLSLLPDHGIPMPCGLAAEDHI